ncbi:MFS transporter [Ktedonosporobacter rubrisoli]|uniref:MFS transporter n=1 Tax=Ktedonosporobacter rubrisoli TaxID=2509675 RepID=A0A4P6JK22_KTERU|nr:MFS transporter [Ktedonosporobacter rubrisoli]QBD74976.1 MFS transporter [Ktedonosporobacter rubrisoli]
MLALLRQRNFGLLWFGGLLSLIGDWLLMIGLPVYVYTLTGSALSTSMMLITGFVPNLLLGSFAGVLVDRWDRRKTMIISNALLAVTLLPLLAVHSQAELWILYIVQFCSGVFSQFVYPAEQALIPLLAGEEQLVAANSLRSISQNFSRLFGSALGGLLIVSLGLNGVVLLDALSFLSVCVMLALMRLPAHLQPREDLAGVAVVEQKLLGAWVEGLRLILRLRPLIIIFAMRALQCIGEGVFGVLLVVFVEKVLHYGAAVYGSLGSMQGIGSLLGGLFIGWIGKRVPSARLLGVCAFLFGLIDLLIINVPLFVPNLFLLWALFIVVGIPSLGMIVGMSSMLQELVDDSLRGRIFGAFQSVEALMVLIGMGLAGAFGDRLGAPLMLNIQGSVYALSGLFVLLTLAGTTSMLQKTATEKPLLQEGD